MSPIEVIMALIEFIMILIEFIMSFIERAQAASEGGRGLNTKKERAANLAVLPTG
jgi:hypothetical protein